MSAMELLGEEILDFATAAQRLAAVESGRPITAGMVRRWASHGVRGVRLEVLRLGSRVRTTWPAIQRFLEALNGESSD